MARENQRGRSGLRRDRALPGFERFERIGRPDNGDVRCRAERRELLNGLMCWSVFAQIKRVMSEYEYCPQVTECGESDGGFHVIEKVEERRRERKKPAVQGDSVDDRAHGMFTYAEMEVASGVRIRLEIAMVEQIRIRRRIEICRTTYEFGYISGDRVHDFSADFARHLRLFIDFRPRDIRGEFSALGSLETSGEFGILLFPRRITLLPLRLRSGAAGAVIAPPGEDVVRYIKRRFNRPTEAFLRLCDVFRTERRAVNFERALFW